MRATPSFKEETGLSRLVYKYTVAGPCQALSLLGPAVVAMNYFRTGLAAIRSAKTDILRELSALKHTH